MEGVEVTMSKYPTLANEAIAAEKQRRLINHAWRSDLATTCEALQQRLAQHDTKRARLAAVLLAGAADDTSRRMAVRLVAAWYPDDVNDCLTK